MLLDKAVVLQCLVQVLMELRLVLSDVRRSQNTQRDQWQTSYSIGLYLCMLASHKVTFVGIMQIIWIK